MTGLRAVLAFVSGVVLMVQVLARRHLAVVVQCPDYLRSPGGHNPDGRGVPVWWVAKCSRCGELGDCTSYRTNADVDAATHRQALWTDLRRAFAQVVR